MTLPPVTLRAATAADVPGIATLEAELFGADAWSSGAVAGEVEGAGRHAVVAVEGEALVGYAVTWTAGEVVDLQRIAVRPDRQRRGVARALLDAALARVRDADAERMLLEVSAANEPALAFYAAAGFTEIDRRRRYYSDGSDAVVMQHSLAAGRGERG